MPHDVIMPALGMAQDSGVIVSWLKAPGEAVAAGEPLLEVETDKATMEVEAAHDGFLTDVRAGAGASVPVGEVVAVIAEAPQGAGEAPAEKAAAAVAGREIIMPALGMAQDSGKILAWLKVPGEAVAVGEALLEVETDKAAMEVEADTAGFLAAVYAPAGADVPVGEVIAVISADKPEAPVAASASPAEARAAGDRGAGPGAATPASVAATANRATANGSDGPAGSALARPGSAATPAGRVLASPKARRLASERGLDIAALSAAAGGAPVHVGDLDRLAAAAPAPAAASTIAPATPPMRIEAAVPKAQFAAFLAFMAADGGAPHGAGPVFAAFAAGTWRAATAAGALGVRLETPGKGAAVHYVDPDIALSEGPEDAAPDLVLRDLTASRLTGLSLGGGEAPMLAPMITVAERGETFALTLEFTINTMSAETALALVHGFAARLEQPLRQLL